MKDKVIAALKNVYDPEKPVNIWDLGLIYDIRVDEDKTDISQITYH
jgi:metal-sulfur cluster biosynthetic enzyme